MVTATEPSRIDDIEAAEAAKVNTSPYRAVLFLLNSLNIGGSEIKAVRVAKALFSKGCPVHLGCLNNAGKLQAQIRDSLPVVDFRRKGKFDPRVLARLGEYVRAHRIRRVLCVNLYPTLYGTIFRTLNPHRDIDCISCINVTDFAKRSEALKMIIYRPALHRASKLVFGCRNQQEQWIARYGLDPKRCTYLYNGVDVERFAPPTSDGERSALRERFGFSAEEVVVVAVAQFRPEKKQEDLIEACRMLDRQGHPVRLVLVGDGPERDRLQHLVAKAGASDRVLFCGQLDDVRPALQACDIFALSSVAVETFSNAALEAMATGKPVVLTDIGGASEMVREGVNGFLYPPGDVETLARKLTLMIEDRAARERMAHQARSAVLDRFTFDSMVREYEELLFPDPCQRGAGQEETGPAPATAPAMSSQPDKTP